MWNKTRKIYILCSLFLSLSLSFVSAEFSPEAYAAGNTNKKAHASYKKKLRSLKNQWGIVGKLKYAYQDVDGDDVDELVVYPGFGMYTQGIFKYRDGKAVEVCAVGQGSFTRYYRKNKVLYSENAGHMGVLTDRYYKWGSGVYQLAAFAVKTYSGSYDKAPDSIKYYVKNKEVAQKRYQSYTGKLVEGSKGKKFSNMKWKNF